PRNLVIHECRPRIADFGIAQAFAVTRGHHAEEYNAGYSAPELFLGSPTLSSDQYSLALIYVELVSGIHPLRVQVRNRAAVARGQYQPDLSLVSALERPALSRALSPDPRRRFGSSTEFIEQLVLVQKEAAQTKTGSLPKVIKVSESTAELPDLNSEVPEPGQLVEGLVKHATQTM